MTDFERTAYRNEIDFLQHEVERYREQNRQLIEIIFKLKDNGNGNGTTREHSNERV